MRAASLALLALLLVACNDNGDRSSTPPTSTPTKQCTDNGLDRPGELPRPPQGRLPCELIPPGLELP